MVRKENAGTAVGFLALSLEPDEQEVLEAARAWNLDMQVAVARGEVLGPLGVSRVPSTVYVSEEGTIVAAASGARSRRFFERRVAELLAK